jgi:predicted Fe-Mo cluster-binding NifX family protein
MKLIQKTNSTRIAIPVLKDEGLLIYKTTTNGSVADILSAFRAGNCPDFPDSALCSHTHNDHHEHHEHSHEDPKEA